jgi:hypothetical protein
VRFLDHIGNAPFDSSLANLAERISTLPWRHPRRVGWVLMQVGIVLCVCSLLFSVRGVQIGTALAIMGGLLAWVPIWRLPLFWFGLAFFLWTMASWMHGRWIAGYPQLPRPQLMGGIGIFAFWLLVPLAATLFSQQNFRRWVIWALTTTIIWAGILLAARLADSGNLYSALGVSGMGIRSSIPGWLNLDIYATNSLTTAFIMAMGFLWLVTMAANDIHWLLRVTGILAAGVTVVIITERSAALGTIIGLFTFVVTARHWRSRLGLATILIVMVSGCYLALETFRPGAVHAVFRGGDSRLQLWQCAHEVIVRHLWFGAGGEPAFEAIMQRTATELAIPVPGYTSHQFLMSLCGCYGVPALVLFILFVGSILQRSWQGRGHDQGRGWRGCLAAMVCMTVTGLFLDLTEFPTQIATVYLALAWSASRIIEQPNIMNDASKTTA